MNSHEIYDLASSGTHENIPLDGKVIETHISWVILSRHLAFKIKKPVRLSFLDFSTLALRRKYCWQELRLNKKWSNIYKTVSPVRKINNRSFIGGSKGRIADYAVVMRRVDDRLKMDALLANNKVSVKDVERLAARLADVHSKAKKIGRPFSLKYARGLFNEIVNFAEVVGDLGDESFEGLIARSIIWSDRFLADHAGRFKERIARGFQREVHGDLHSGNIFIEDEPVIFDCIEFNDRYRQIDILYEIAFLAMDIEAYGHPRLAAVLLREYKKRIKCIETREDILIQKYFMCLRANVRAKVHLIQMMNADQPTTARDHAREAARYLKLMDKYISDDFS